MRLSLQFFGVALIAGLALQGGCSITGARTAENINDRMLQRRAVGAVIWGMPAVNAELMFQAMADAQGEFNQIIYWSRLPSWKNQTLTSNPDTICFMPFYNTKDAGPMVLEIPPADNENSITGSIDDAWQTALEDVGPIGADMGKGGKYLILPPGYKDKPPGGYIVLPSSTYAGFALLRSNLTTADDAGIAKAVAYGKRVKLYPLSQAASPRETKFVDASDVLFQSTIPYDLRFFQMLDRFVQREPWLARDNVMIDQLKSIGIEKGKPFDIAAEIQQMLRDAAREAHAWLEDKYVRAYLSPPYYDDGHWTMPGAAEAIANMDANFSNPDGYPMDNRSLAYSLMFSSPKKPAAGQCYLITIVDSAGMPLDGGSIYRLHLPPNAPVASYWSVTAYDRATHALIRETPWPGRSSITPGLVKNLDGSVDIYFGPRAPAWKESNTVPTSAGRQFEVLFRFYGPDKPLFDKTWKLPELQKIQ